MDFRKMLNRFRKLKWAVVVGGLMSVIRGIWPDLVLPEGFNETLVGVAMAVTFFTTRESAEGIETLKATRD